MPLHYAEVVKHFLFARPCGARWSERWRVVSDRLDVRRWRAPTAPCFREGVAERGGPRPVTIW